MEKSKELSIGFRCETVETTSGKIYYRCVGNRSDPLFLIVHGSGTGNSGKWYEFLLHEYNVRYQANWPIFMVAFDCPGYGKSTGLRSYIRAFPCKFLTELCYLLTGKKECFILMGHSQGGFSAFNAALQNDGLCQILVQDRPVCGDFKRFKNLEIPTLLVYDENDDGHPISQGRILSKELPVNKFLSYSGTNNPYWICDHLLEEIIKFIYENQKLIPSNYLPNFGIISENNGIELNLNCVKDNKIMSNLSKTGQRIPNFNTDLNRKNENNARSITLDYQLKNLSKIDTKKSLSRENSQTTIKEDIILEEHPQIIKNSNEKSCN